MQSTSSGAMMRASITEQEESTNRGRLFVIAHNAGLTPADLQTITALLQGYPKPSELPPVPLTYGDACLRDVFPSRNQPPEA